MGALTLTEIVTEGMLRAGDDTVTTRVTIGFKAWLREQARRYPWPTLLKKKQGLALAAGSTAVNFGNGEGGETRKVCEIRRPLWVYRADFTGWKRADIIALESEASEPDVFDTTTRRGVPATFKVRAHDTIQDCWRLEPQLVPDRDYVLIFQYQVVPSDPADVDRPWYPNDETSIHAVMMLVHEYTDGIDSPAHKEARALVANKIIDDRNADGAKQGTNDSTGLDPSIFR